MVPFSLRLLYACLPQYLGRHNESLDRLFHVKGTVVKILHNLQNGLGESGECGGAASISDSSRTGERQRKRVRQRGCMTGRGELFCSTCMCSVSVAWLLKCLEKLYRIAIDRAAFTASAFYITTATELYGSYEVNLKFMCKFGSLVNCTLLKLFVLHDEPWLPMDLHFSSIFFSHK